MNPRLAACVATRSIDRRESPVAAAFSGRPLTGVTAYLMISLMIGFIAGILAGDAREASDCQDAVLSSGSLI